MQSPSETPATGWPGGASTRSKVTVVPSSVARRSAHSAGFSTSAPTKAWWVAGANACGAAAGRDAAEAWVDLELEAAPLQEHASGVPRVGEAHLRTRSCRDPHAVPVEEGDGGLQVGDLERDRVHSAAEAGDELGRTPVDDRLADLDRVVPGPRHATTPADARLGGLAVLEDLEPDQVRECCHGAAIVVDHRGRVKEPADLVAPAHRHCLAHDGGRRLTGLR